jgi:uncharacterized protein (DUF486 family)
MMYFYTVMLLVGSNVFVTLVVWSSSVYELHDLAGRDGELGRSVL